MKLKKIWGYIYLRMYWWKFKVLGYYYFESFDVYGKYLLSVFFFFNLYVVLKSGVMVWGFFVFDNRWRWI